MSGDDFEQFLQTGSGVSNPVATCSPFDATPSGLDYALLLPSSSSRTPKSCVNHPHNTNSENNEKHCSCDSFHIWDDCIVCAAGTFAGQEADNSRSQGLEGQGQDEQEGEGAAPIAVD